MKYFDSHCHLQLPQFDADRAEVLARMQGRAEGAERSEVGAIVIGTDFETSKAGLELAKQYDFLWASVGLHPNEPSTSSGQTIPNEFEELAKDPKVVAIGECGLDYFRSGGTDEEKAAQKMRFEKHIELAVKVSKPLIIHCRNAHDDCSSVLQKTRITKKVPVVIHFFTAAADIAKKYLELGCYLSFPGPITYTDMYDESIRVTPLDKILAETDAPFAAPVPHRGKRNEPAYVAEVVQKIAAVKKLSVEEVAYQIVLNSQQFFGLQ
jgi:TatD DNase family protein